MHFTFRKKSTMPPLRFYHSGIQILQSTSLMITPHGHQVEFLPPWMNVSELSEVNVGNGSAIAH